MLEEILNSKPRFNLLSFLFVAPPRSFSATELSKRLALSRSKVIHTLNSLAKEGMINEFSKRGKKYYLLNTRHLSYPEIKHYLLQKRVRYEDELINAIKKLGKIKSAFLSGIFAGYSHLPVDVLLVGKVNLKQLDGFLKRVEKVMGQEINYSIMSPKEFTDRRDTFDRFIKDIFDHRHIVVVDSLKSKVKALAVEHK